MLKPSGGTILLDGADVRSMSYRNSARKMAVVAQHNAFNFDFTVGEVVLMGRAPHKRQMERDTVEDYRIVREALEQVDMADYENRMFSTLSGGEQQRAILARALAQKTRCLILDEPTNHLDIKHQMQILKLVKLLGITILAALHDLNIAALFCDYLYVLKDGEIQNAGTPKEVLTPELIRNIYEVEAKVLEDEDGCLHILYRMPV